MTTSSDVTFTHPSGSTVKTLCESFQESAKLAPDKVALRTPGGAQEISWREYAERVRKIAAGLASLGVTRGDTVGIMLTNRPEFHLVDTAALHLGATPFSIYNTSSADQISYLFTHAENKVVITEQAFLRQVTGAESLVEQVVVVDGSAEGAMTLADLEAAGADDFDFESTWHAVEPGDVATLIYTSGTTGPPKGVELTHANLIATAAAVSEVMGVQGDDRCASYLPSAHIADRISNHYMGMLFGATITSVGDPKAMLDALADVRPTVWLSVPRVWQKVKAGIEGKIAGAGGVKAMLGTWAIDVGQQVARRTFAGEDVPFLLSLQHKIAEILVLSKLRHALGLDECRFALTGAAAIPTDTLVFFHGIGVAVYEGWGMSETGAAGTVNRPGAIKLGSVGQALPSVELSLAGDGELLMRGPVLMRGYRKDPDKTAEAIDVDGWLHTGDIAEIDDEGFVKIVDRKKELIINGAGKNMSPTNIENAMKSGSSLISQVVAIGDARPYNTALIVLDPEVVEAAKDKLGLTDTSPAGVAENPKVRGAITEAVNAGNTKLSRVEQIKRFTILPAAWDPGGDEMTPTMKLKRKPIAEKYAPEIDGLYAKSPAPTVIDLG